MKTLGVCIPFSSGLFGTMCPLPTKLTVCFGEPISWTPKVKGEPTREEINAAHADYMVAIKALFDKHKGALGYGDRELTLV